jgi:hypothetical protein
MISGLPPGMYNLPPIARKSFLFASTSFETMCQWPIVRPISLNAAGCAAAAPAVSVDANNNATNTFVFMDASLCELSILADHDDPSWPEASINVAINAARFSEPSRACFRNPWRLIASASEERPRRKSC